MIMKRMNRLVGIGLSGIILVSALTGCGAAGSSAECTTAAAAGETYKEQNTQAYEPAAAETTAAGNYDGVSGKSDRALSYQDVYGSDSYSAEEYSEVVENGIKSVAEHPLSTFSIDVDTAAYSNIRRMINQGEEINPDAVRIEEMINYFNYEYRKPEGSVPFAITTELSDCPWNKERQLLLVGLQAREIDFDKRPMSNLVFLLDVSGSMYDKDKLPLVQKSFSLLTEELTENDRVSIVTYAGYDQVVLEGARGDEKKKIRKALEKLRAGGSTAGEAGINRAYDLAAQYYIPGGNNRVILATDGDLNVGVSSPEELTRLVEEKRKSGVHLSVLGFGTGNIKDNKMEALADNGDGNYNYIDSLTEAKKVLVEEMGGTLITVAKDVKIQVEFNPAEVAGYRLIGYENRELADRDFHDDKVDAGEIGSGHRVTALYELIRSDSDQSLKYQDQPETSMNGELLTVSIRYKAPNGNESKEVSAVVEADQYQSAMPANLRFASTVAEFGMLLRDSEYKGTASYEQILDQLDQMSGGMDEYKNEFRQLVLKVMDR